MANVTFPVPSYSAFGEDRLILKLLESRGRGFYVDVGCHHPIDYSNTYALYQRGWRGIAIDPDPVAIAAFRATRPRDIPCQCAIGLEAGEAILHLFNDRSMNTLDAASFARFKAKPRKRHLGDIRVERRPLAAVLAELLPPGEAVDFLNVDCEGTDLEVLRSNDWSRHRPALIAVEDFSLDLAESAASPIHRYLRERGYRLDSHLRLTSLYRPIAP